MCGRYAIFTDEEIREMQDIINEIDNKFGKGAASTGEIYPTNAAPVFIAQEGCYGATLMKWGFPQYRSKGVIINARSETVPEKHTFRSSLQNRRCIVPTTGFYEWKQTSGKAKKEKYIFNLPDSPMVYLAGLYTKGKIPTDSRYVIITTDANESMKPYHHRIPVVVTKDLMQDWIHNTEFAMEYLHQASPQLVAKMV